MTIKYIPISHNKKAFDLKAHLIETCMNKIVSLLLLVLPWIILPLVGVNDMTGPVFLMLFAIPLFFAKENWIGRRVI